MSTILSRRREVFHRFVDKRLREAAIDGFASLFKARISSIDQKSMKIDAEEHWHRLTGL